MTGPDVIVVGAGPAGLSAAASLRGFGIAAVVVERADAVAASWRARYDRLRLNTCRWTSRLPNSRYPRGTPLFPSRDQMVGYLEGYAEQHGLDIRLGTQVDRIDRDNSGWRLTTTNGDLAARHVVVATGHQHTPRIPPWPGRDQYPGRLLHAAEYRNPQSFENLVALVVGPGCSGLEIAYDLAVGGAAQVYVAVRTQPNIMLRQSGGLPGDIPARLLLHLPVGIADRQASFVRRRTVGDLSRWGLTPPIEGTFSRHYREGKAPAILDKEVITAIKAGRIEIVAALQSFEGSKAEFADGSRLDVDVVIAATGYTTGLESIVGHLGVLDEHGMPRVHGGPEVAPGLRFIGYRPGPGQIGDMGREAVRAAKAIRAELPGT